MLIDDEGRERVCSRELNAQLFRLCIGGYGLFGIVARRQAEARAASKAGARGGDSEPEDVPVLFERRINEGCLYGDFQYATDHASKDFMRRGVFSLLSADER
ncbi:MAG: hypothetical protein WKF84_22425 [Pyrinomonadaceae bacterium]